MKLLFRAAVYLFIESGIFLFLSWTGSLPNQFIIFLLLGFLVVLLPPYPDIPAKKRRSSLGWSSLSLAFMILAIIVFIREGTIYFFLHLVFLRLSLDAIFIRPREPRPRPFSSILLEDQTFALILEAYASFAKRTDYGLGILKCSINYPEDISTRDAAFLRKQFFHMFFEKRRFYEFLGRFTDDKNSFYLVVLDKEEAFNLAIKRLEKFLDDIPFVLGDREIRVRSSFHKTFVSPMDLKDLERPEFLEVLTGRSPQV